MKPHDVSEDQIKLRALPFSLLDSAKECLYDLPPGSVTTWNGLARLLLDKYFPETKASSLRREIIGIKQGKKEALHTYWERFKKLCARCPQHGIFDYQLFRYFCEGLTPMERRLINASSGGSLIDQTPTQIRALIEKMAEESKHTQGEDEWYADPSRSVKEVSTPYLESQISQLTKAVMQLTKDKGIEPAVRACGICLQYGHPTDMCPELQEEQEQAKAMGGFTGQNQRPLEPNRNNQNWNYSSNQNYPQQNRNQYQERSQQYYQNPPP
ncbi:hypothetical protein L2E82_37425 [Cichorium intybus]|uniref:Uncharacterized protein n=1 Tax=Cichorium intybus TaxID=13427 RepID=A0ACB9AE91_CICIN|nr:hypothetical protein L2E82_37425 [Cichorium intybus]